MGNFSKLDFERNGYAVIKNFLSLEEVQAAKSAIWDLVDGYDPMEAEVFSIGGDRDQMRGNYFLDSADRISYFLEDGVTDSEHQLKVEKRLSLNKIGHGLHIHNDVFRRITFSSKVKDLMNEIGYEEPAVVQSMYIFKHPRHGKQVPEHIDASYLNVDPIDNLVGLWIPIDDATLENGCLWFIPGSHKVTEIPTRLARSTDPASKHLLKITGSIPDDWKDPNRFVPVPVNKGDLVLIHGLVVHKSADNLSEDSRHAYTFHVMESKRTKWNPENWLQLSEGKSFPRIM